MIVYLLILFLDTITTKITKKIICIHKNNNNCIEIQVKLRCFKQLCLAGFHNNMRCWMLVDILYTKMLTSSFWLNLKSDKNIILNHPKLILRYHTLLHISNRFSLAKKLGTSFHTSQCWKYHFFESWTSLDFNWISRNF